MASAVEPGKAPERFFLVDCRVIIVGPEQLKNMVPEILFVVKILMKFLVKSRVLEG